MGKVQPILSSARGPLIPSPPVCKRPELDQRISPPPAPWGREIIPCGSLPVEHTTRYQVQVTRESLQWWSQAHPLTWDWAHWNSSLDPWGHPDITSGVAHVHVEYTLIIANPLAKEYKRKEIYEKKENY